MFLFVQGYIVVLIETICCVMFYATFCEKKRENNRYINAGIPFLLSVVTHFVTLYLDAFFLIKQMAVIILTVIAMGFYMKCSIRKNIILSLIFQSLLIIADFITIIIDTSLLSEDSMANEMVVLFVVLMSKTVLLLIVFFIKLFFRRKSVEYISEKDWLKFLLFPFFSLATIIAMVSNVELVTEEKQVTALWMIATGMICMSIFIFYFIMDVAKRERLLKEADMNAHLLEVQKDYYMMLLKKENETKAFRHDIKNHIYCMNSLYDKKDYERLGSYISDLNREVIELSPKIDTGNGLITAMINDIAAKFPQVELQWSGRLVEDMKISSLDMCTIFYNLLVNAYEAADKAKEKQVKAEVRFMESAMAVTICNGVENMPEQINGEYISSKQGEGHGYGIHNVKKCVEKNNGMYSVKCEDGMFITDIILLDVIKYHKQRDVEV